LIVPLAAVSALAMQGACVENFQFEFTGAGGVGGSSTSTGVAGGGAAGGPASSSSGTGGGKTCNMAAECGDICGTPACDMGECSWTNPKPNGSADLFTQVYGDCKERQCRDGEAVEVALAGDKYDWSNECFADDCYTGDMPAVKTGASCAVLGGGSGKCSPSGVCRRCLVNMDCPSEQKCSPFGKCLASTCSNGMKDGNETDVDCGNACNPCDVAKLCNSPTDCKDRGACKSSPKVCFGADCYDSVRNQDETDVDCGGTCASNGLGPNMGKCGVNALCLYPSDCESNNCVAGVCK
jgi:hypothetical protein